MLRRLRECTARTQAGIAAKGFLVPSSLSNHLNGGRIPEDSLLRSFFTAVEADASTAGTELPCTLAELLELRRLARVQHCGCPSHPAPGQLAEGPAADDSPASAPPGIRAAHRSHSRKLRRISRARTLSRSALPGAVNESKVPVPPFQGDRPRAELSGVAWTEVETVARFLAEGRNRDAGFLLWRAGRTLDAQQVMNAVASCRNAGLDDAAESVLTSVSERADRQAVLNITAALQGAGRHRDVGFLLSAAVK